MSKDTDFSNEMGPDFGFSDLPDEVNQDQEVSTVFNEYLRYVARKKLGDYKKIIHISGDKQGQSYYSHVMDLVTVAEQLRLALQLSDTEMRCVLLALTVHDINKIPPYGKGLDDKDVRYADAATMHNIQDALEKLDADAFFPRWRTYLDDIFVLVHYHQESATGTTVAIDQRKIDRGKLGRRLTGPLKYLMKAADVSDNSHSGDYRNTHEMHIRDKLLQHINAAMPERQYRFIGHRLAELRGLFTNTIHNVIVHYLRERYGEESCIDLLYHPEGVDYLLDTHIPLEWSVDTLRDIAQRLGKRLANIQLEALAQFIKPKPAGIVVDSAAISSGATVEQIFTFITIAVNKKQYKAEWRELRNNFVHNDLEEFFSTAKDSSDNELKEKVISLLKQSDLISPEESVLKRGEFVSAYRKFLEDHRSDQLKALKEDAWLRIYHLFALPESQCNIYQLIDPFRRGYFLARDLPGIDIKDMMVMALQDLAELEQQARQALSNKKAKHIANNGSTAEAKTLQEELVAAPAHSEYLVDYLKRNLEVWDSRAGQSSSAKPILVEDFVDSLRQYANPKRVHAQCCHCGSPLKASEWMAIQVPSNMGVQSFSNRLEGGSLRDPKRNVCDVCRMQFILEKLAWRSHGDKQGSEQVTFYLHLFPYAFFTKPLLEDWWERVETLGDSDHTAFFINVGEYFRHADQSQKAGEIPGFATNTNGIGKPALSEALSNTPILPIIAPGDNYGLQFMLALEKAIVLVRWFECRAILSRSPVPPLNLANERVDNEPAVLMIEGMPRNISWLLPQTILHRQHLDNELCTKLNLLYRIVARLYYKGGEFDAIPHDLAVAAVDDSLALYFEADRLIEKTAEKCNASPEQLTRDIAPLLEQLITLS